MWIFGSPRSGSTWLLQMLREHPGVVGINEPLIGYYLGPFTADAPGTDAEALDIHTFTMRRLQAANINQFFAEQFAHVWVPGLRDLMRRRFAAHVARYPPASGSRSAAIVAVKEPNGSQSADILGRCMPRSRMLLLLRDGRDVVDSELAANLEGSWVGREFPGGGGLKDADRLDFVVQSACKWTWRTQTVRQAFAAHQGPKLMVRYEELLADPEGQLAAVYAWLGLSAERGWLREACARHRFERIADGERGESSFYRSARPGAWAENLRAEERAAAERIMGPVLRELDYA